LAQLIAKIDFDEEENNQDQAGKQNGEKSTEKSLDEITSARKFYQTIYERVRSALVNLREF
jgi:hypothetical protein